MRTARQPHRRSRKDRLAKSTIQREKKFMCDYSLMCVPNRLAREGEELLAHRFTTGSMGLASDSDLHPRPVRSAPSKRTFWSMVKQVLDPPEANPVPAVCVPPGARLMLRDIPEQLQREVGVGPVEEVTFTQIAADSHRYRDAVRFRNGREILLQRLIEGQRVRVLECGPDDRVDDTVPDERLSRALG
jgi:hypothetical protein